MERSGRPRPGDGVIRRRRVRQYRLRRVLGIPALFSAGYGDVGSSIYYALGIVALVAVGATPIALAIAGIIYIFNALTYAEGSAMLPEAGGSASFARHGFNDLVSFISGWALMLSYIVTIAISVYTIPPYLSFFWEPLKEPEIGTTISMGIILFLMVVNIIGIRASSRVNICFIGVDIATQVSLIVLGVWLILWQNPGVLVQNMFGEGNWPTIENLVFGIAFAALAFTGVETVSQIAEEARHPATQAPKAYILMIVTVLVLFAGISVVALSAMTPQMLGDPVNGWARDPVAGIAANLPSETLQTIYKPLVAVLAATILLTASNAGMMGISRLAFNLGMHQEMPSALRRIHTRFKTPYLSIILFSLVVLLVLIPGFFPGEFFTKLGALYAFGSLLCFALAHLSILSLRVRKPDLPRPFKLGLNISIRGRKLPLTAILGLLATSGIWLVIIIMQPYSRLVGFSWMFLGLLAYYLYRRRVHLSLTQAT
jgi:APA family basic amino acid/polyamine antiporter